ncbi:hypothetical protein Bbelb_305740 [Branchiostoma belcheri]|nr:hypothetical protein Bbelb_305740 [Branchiostoma belcheri]
MPTIEASIILAFQGRGATGRSLRYLNLALPTLLRMPEERLPKFLLEWTPNYGKRSRGRPRKTWLACVLEDARTTMQQPSLTLEDLKTIAHDRQVWRRTLCRRRDDFDAGHSQR